MFDVSSSSCHDISKRAWRILGGCHFIVCFEYQTSKRGWKKKRLSSKQLSISFAMQTWIISKSITIFSDIAWLYININQLYINTNHLYSLIIYQFFQTSKYIYIYIYVNKWIVNKWYSKCLVNKCLSFL